MEKSKDEEKNKKFTSTIKNKMFKGYEKIRNKMNMNFDLNDKFQRFSYDNEKISNFSPSNTSKYFNDSNSKLNQKDIYLNTNVNNMNNLRIRNLSEVKKVDYNNTLNNLFFSTSNIIKNQKYIKGKKTNMIINNFNSNNSPNNIKEKIKILDKLFPDIGEINKYSNLPFFSLIKVRNPYKMKLHSNNKKEVLKQFPQEKFLYKISHSNNEEEKINNNFIKNKGIKKGRTTKYFHGISKFCINNKISETNFIKEEDLKKKNFKLQLDIENLKKGEKIPQISNKEKHIKILQNNLNNIKSIPDQIVNDLEDGVFKFIDEEFDKANNEALNQSNSKKNEEYKINLPPSLENNVPKKKDESSSTNRNIIDLTNQFKVNKSNSSKKFLITLNDNQNNSKNISDYNKSTFFNSSGFKKPHQYPINFYSTQQIKIKEHFNKTHKNTFEERNKKIKKGSNSERNTRKQLSGEMIDNINELQRKKIINNKYAFNKDCKIRDIIIGNKLKCEFTPVDIKRILNGLKPWADIKLDDEVININIDNNKI